MSVDTSRSTQYGRQGRRRADRSYACSTCGETDPQAFYSYRPSQCKRCHRADVAARQRRNPERHRAAQRRYAAKTTSITLFGDPIFTDAAEAASARLAEMYERDYLALLVEEMAKRGIDPAEVLEQLNIAPGSVIIA